jgi:hypothetical protein
MSAPSPIPAAPSDVAGLLERLREVVNLGEYLRSATTQFDRDNRVPEYARRERLTTAAAQEAAALIESLTHDREVMREALETKLLEAKINCDGSESSVAYAEGVIDTYNVARAALASLKGGAK